MTDVEIIQSILSGNTDRFRVLVEKYQSMVFRTAIGFIHSKEDAEDLTQEIFLKAFQSLDSFMGHSEFSTWLYRITVNLSLNAVDRRKIARFFDYTDEKHQAVINMQNSEATPEQAMIDKERDKQVRNAIDQLSRKQKTAFILSRYEELPQKEIAAIMQTTEGAVEQHLQRAKVNLQKRLASIVGK